VPPSKTLFNLAELKHKSLSAVENQIEEIRTYLAETYSPENQAMEEAEWRKRQEKRLSDLFKSLDKIPNSQLASFRLEPLPSDSEYEIRDLKRKLWDLEYRKKRILARADSIVPDNNGHVYLTPTQLKNFFDL
jgi:hypothetical protein